MLAKRNASYLQGGVCTRHHRYGCAHAQQAGKGTTSSPTEGLHQCDTFQRSALIQLVTMVCALTAWLGEAMLRLRPHQAHTDAAQEPHPPTPRKRRGPGRKCARAR